EGAMITAAQTAAGDIKGLSQLEKDGLLTQKKGEGMASKLLAASGDSYDQLSKRMQAHFDDAGKLYDKGRQLLSTLQKSIGGDEEAFAQKALELQATIADLNAFHLTGLANQSGIGQVQAAHDEQSANRVRSGLGEITGKLTARAQQI